MRKNFQQQVRDAIQHLKYGPIIPASQLHITYKYTCPKCHTHVGTKMHNMYGPTSIEMRCGWCHYTYPIPD